MKLITTISIVAVLGLSACNSTSVDSTKAKVEEKVMDEKATDGTINDTATETTVAVKEEPNPVEKHAVLATDAPITNIYWKLETFEGKNIEDAANPHDQPHFMINTKDNRVTGNSGCNGFFGSFFLEDGNRVKFDKLASTRRACANSVVNEHEFMQVFGQVDSYSIRGDVLELYNGKSAPLVVFKALKAKS